MYVSEVLDVGSSEHLRLARQQCSQRELDSAIIPKY